MTSESNLSGLVKILHFKQQIFRSCGVRLKSLFVTQLDSGARLRAECCLITVYASFRTFVTWIPGLASSGAMTRARRLIGRLAPVLASDWLTVTSPSGRISRACTGCHQSRPGLNKNNFRDCRVIKTHGKSFEHHTSKTYAKRKILK